MDLKLSKYNRVTLHKTKPADSATLVIDYPEVVFELFILKRREQSFKISLRYWIVLIDANDKLIGIAEVDNDSKIQSETKMKQILQIALLSETYQIILVQNSPGDNLLASHKDVEFRQDLNQILIKFGCAIKYHLIFNTKKYEVSYTNTWI